MLLAARPRRAFFRCASQIWACYTKPINRSFCEGVTEDQVEVVDRVGDTWRYQDKLPPLPLPTVKSTCETYRKFLRPLLTEEEFQEAEKPITKFESASIAEDLQSQLENLTETEGRSWLEGFWDQMYLDIRDPLPINVNPFFLWNSIDLKSTREWETAARLVHAYCRANKVLRMRKLQPDMEGNKPLCMYQYTKAFGGTRYPGSGVDRFASNRYAKHIIVMKRGKMFSLVVETEDQMLLPVSKIRAALCEISNLVDSAESIDDIGYFTCSNRDEWAKNYQYLQQLSEQNKTNLDIVCSALAVVNLEDEDFSDVDVASKSVFHNRGANRWFDKLQIIVSKMGGAGINMEHTPIDGHTIVRIATDMFEEASGRDPYEDVPVMTADDVAEATVSSLNWDLDTTLRDALAKAKSDFEAFADQTEGIPVIADYGKRTMKRCNTSPDAFVQMAIQLAYYREYGRFDSTYESALTKQFLHGRTETIRSVTEKAKHFCRTFDPEDIKTTGANLVAACEEHVAISKLCKNGKGVDRHLFGLNCLAKKEKAENAEFKIPEMFTSPYYAKYASNILSTSNCGSDAVGLFGFGPVHPEGFGVGYLIQENKTLVHISAINGKGKAFAKAFADAFALQLNTIRKYQEYVTAETK